MGDVLVGEPTFHQKRDAFPAQVTGYVRKITDITTKRNIATNDLKQQERMEIGKQNLASDEAIYRYDQDRADAAAKGQRFGDPWQMAADIVIRMARA